MKCIVNIIKTIFYTLFIISIFIGIFILLPKQANAELFQVDDLNIEYLNYTHAGHDPLITDNGLSNRGMDKNLSFNLNTSINDYFYFKGKVHSDTDYDTLTGSAGQFRSIGLETELGLRTTNYIDIFVYHHSQHVMDTTYPTHFPVKDAIGIRINLIKKRKDDSLLQ